ncbi:hypothetical protein C9F09_21610, partial [Salmonella enterica subsp. enterica serovar Wilhelmsburg]
MQTDPRSLIVMCILPDEISSQDDAMSVAHVALQVPHPRTVDNQQPECRVANAQGRLLVPFG